MRVSILATFVVIACSAASLARAEDLTKSTFTISGLHCPPCTRTVQSSLAKMPGIKSAKVDWQTKSAKIEFDQGKTSAQQIAEHIATTPHMMGGGMQYAGRLALSVPDIKDEATANAAKEALTEVKGVKTVAAFPTQHTVTIAFDSNGNASIRDLIAALDKAGLKATSY